MLSRSERARQNTISLTQTEIMFVFAAIILVLLQLKTRENEQLVAEAHKTRVEYEVSLSETGSAYAEIRRVLVEAGRLDSQSTGDLSVEVQEIVREVTGLVQSETDPHLDQPLRDILEKAREENIVPDGLSDPEVAEELLRLSREAKRALQAQSAAQIKESQAEPGAPASDEPSEPHVGNGDPSKSPEQIAKSADAQQEREGPTRDTDPDDSQDKLGTWLDRLLAGEGVRQQTEPDSKAYQSNSSDKETDSLPSEENEKLRQESEGSEAGDKPVLSGNLAKKVGFDPCWPRIHDNRILYHWTYSTVYDRDRDRFQIRAIWDESIALVSKDVNGPMSVLRDYPRGWIDRNEFTIFGRRVERARSANYPQQCRFVTKINDMGQDAIEFVNYYFYTIYGRKRKTTREN